MASKATRLLAAALCCAAVLLCALPAFAAPVNPRFAYACAPKTNEVLINWEPLRTYTGTVKYHLYRATASAGPYTEIAVLTGVNNISYIDNGGVTLSYLRRYWYRIAAEDGTGLNATAQYMSGTPTGITAEALMSPTTGPPLEPRALEATAVVDGSTVQKVTLDWEAPGGPNIVRYEVYRQAASGVDGVLVGTSVTTTFDDTSAELEVEEHYWYRVAAVASYGGVERAGPKSFEIYIRPMSNREIDMPHGGGSGSTTGETCLQCHDIHAAPSANLLLYGEGSGPELCMSCHDGTGSKYDIRTDFDMVGGSVHDLDGGTYVDGDLVCADCHTPHGDPESVGSYKLLRAYDVSSGIEYCLVCHKPDTPDYSTYDERTSDMTPFRTSAHNAAGVADPPSGTGIKCRTCHLPHSSPNEDLLMYKTYRACFNCHSYASGGSLSSPDIYAKMTASTDTDAHHDVLQRDQDQPGSGRMACQNCHNSHAAAESNALIDPNDPSPLNPYPQSVNPAFAAATDNWRNSFCFECHDNVLPTAAATEPWVPAPLWSTKAVDNDLTTDSYFYNPLTNWGIQKHGKRTTTSELIWPEVRTMYGNDPELECRACHEAHGTVNIRNLRSDMAGKQGLVAIDLSNMGLGAGYDSRFWCMGCHQDCSASHGTQAGKTWNTFPRDCTRGTACHGHQSGGGQF